MKFQFDINHNPVVYKVIVYHLECLGWEIQTNAELTNPNWPKYIDGIPRYFQIDIETKRFDWIGGEESEPTGLDCIDSFEDANAFMMFLRENIETMKNVPVPLPPPMPPAPTKYQDYYAKDDPYSHYQQQVKKSAMIDKLLAYKKELLEDYHHATQYGPSYKQESLYHKIKQIEDKIDSCGYTKTKYPSYYDHYETAYNPNYGYGSMDNCYYVSPKWKMKSNGLDY